MKYWEQIEKKFQHGVETITTHLVIDDNEREHDLYVKVGWWHGRPVWVDLTIARHADEGSVRDTIDVHVSALPLITKLKQRIMDNTRAFLDVTCREASLLLSFRRCMLTDLSDLWRATEMEPRGKCFKVADPVLGDRVHGPLDAAARLFQVRAAEWEKRMAYEYGEDEIESMLASCRAALEDRPDDFTEFERGFIESAADDNETTHLTGKQVEKLEQIWEDRDCG